MTTDARMRVFMVDDHEVVRDGLRTLLELAGGVTVVGTAESAEAALEMVDARSCDLVLLDLELTAKNGIWCARALKERHPGLRVLVLTMHADERLVADAVEAGADGYLLKSASRDEVFRAMREIHAGGTYIDPRVSGSLVVRLRQGKPSEAELPHPASLVQLSRREREILTMAAQGMNNKDIAERLGVAQNTIKTHLRSIYRKCGVPDRLQAVLYAMRNGLA